MKQGVATYCSHRTLAVVLAILRAIMRGLSCLFAPGELDLERLRPLAAGASAQLDTAGPHRYARQRVSCCVCAIVGDSVAARCCDAHLRINLC